jgi:chromosome segregation ATPase
MIPYHIKLNIVSRQGEGSTMQQVASYEMVAGACEKLEREGLKITGRSVLIITGGSLATVLGHIKRWRLNKESAPSLAPVEIPSDVQGVILRALGQAQVDAADKLKEEIDQAGAREAEALEGLSGAERRIEQLTDELNAIRTRAEEERQATEKTAAVATERIDTLVSRVQELETERRQLIEAAEASRTETAKAQLQIARADEATAKAEARAEHLEAQLADTLNGRVAAEKAQAVAEQRSNDQSEALVELRAALSEVKGESKATISEQKTEILALRKTVADLEGRVAGLLADKSSLEKALALEEERNNFSQRAGAITPEE